MLEENSLLKRKDLQPATLDAMPATGDQILQGITRHLFKLGWVSAASFQETTKVLNAAAINGSVIQAGLKKIL